ncbi:MAG TPA: hypothetical protein VFW44_17445 [Bryobacteraceae bacterium]|nr:hypothetical protein [Bryobacteraceae bacterium]
MKFAKVLCLIAIFSAAVVAADASYFGKWKPNSAKSEMTANMTIQKLAAGEYRFEADGFAYKFKLDGKEHPTPDGSTSAWKAVDDQHWEIVNRVNGKVSSRYKIQVNGDTLSTAVTVPQPDGKSITENATLKRVSGGPGIVGQWKTDTAEMGQVLMDIIPDGPNGLKLSGGNSLCLAKFDGKPYPMSGTGDAPKQTMSFRKTGPSSFETMTYINGKPFFKDVYTVSADGKVLTDVGTPVATGKTSKVVFDRQ